MKIVKVGDQQTFEGALKVSQPRERGGREEVMVLAHGGKIYLRITDPSVIAVGLAQVELEALLFTLKEVQLLG